MFRSANQYCYSPSPSRSCSATFFFFLSAIFVFGQGCDNSNIEQRQALAAMEDPQGEFEWGMTRLERALQQFRPGGSEGMLVKRSLKHELIPPSKDRTTYTARVTITSEASFLHGKRRPKKKEEKKPDETFKLDDPLDDGSEELLDFPSIDTGATITAPVQIETRSLDTEKVYEMAYVDGHWELTQEPELEYEQLWFEYAFN